MATRAVTDLAPHRDPGLPIGVGPSIRPDPADRALHEITFDLGRGRAAVILGAPGSGRSTALAHLVHSARRLRLPHLHVDADSNPTPSFVNALNRAELVFVDDPTALAPAIAEQIATAFDHRGGLRLIAAGSAVDLSMGYSGLPGRLRGSRTGLILGRPDPLDADYLGVSARLLRGRTEPPPGRGWLISGGRIRPLQVYA
jgi:hypothetical protein